MATLSTTADPELHANPARARKLGGIERAVQLVYFGVSVISALLLLRFTLLALGVNQTNAFAKFLLALSYPFAAPFLTLFGSNPEVGNSILQFPLLVAVVVYALFGWFLTKLLRLMFAPTDPTGAAYQD